jgi:hypothetical protein
MRDTEVLFSEAEFGCQVYDHIFDECNAHILVLSAHKCGSAVLNRSNNVIEGLNPDQGIDMSAFFAVV